MPQRLSRRELIAWLAAGTGAAATGAVVLSGAGSNDAASGRGAMASTSDPPTVHQDPVARGSMQPTQTVGGERLLVVVELPGGNDGLSMAVPYGAGRYYDVRESTAIAPSDVLRIDDTVGLHPNLVGLHARGVTLVHGVGSTTPDGSHFEMLNRWWSGNSTRADMSTGWIGRLADVLRDGAGGDVPALALSVGSGDHPIIRSTTGSTLSLPGVDALWAMVGADPDDRFVTAYQSALRSFAEPVAGHGGRYRETLAATLRFADRVIGDDIDQGNDDPEAAGYSWSGLGRGLWLASRLFAADTGIRVVHVTMDGDFDTHDGHTWQHPELMAELDSSLTAFHADLEQRGLADRVLVATTSEFGRTLHENGSDGLDHGTASTMVLSGPITGIQVGDIPSLTTLDENDDLIATAPLEAYLAGVVEGWFDVPASEVFPGSEPLALFT
jgi:uncharacterized protein (DUF1501 family)